MNRIFGYFLVAVFAIFLGSQITEGCLLLPYWKSLSAAQFYTYYAEYGPSIAQFYTILTVIALLISIFTSIYCFVKKSSALTYSIISSFFALIFVAFFYIYFKDTNQQFYNAAFDLNQLESELISWGYWHWSRVFFEVLSLGFLMLALNILTSKRA